MNVTLVKLQASLHTARQARETAGKPWDTALAALKRGARAAADDDAPGLYRALSAATERNIAHQTKEDHMANNKHITSQRRAG